MIARTLWCCHRDNISVRSFAQQHIPHSLAHLGGPLGRPDTAACQLQLLADLAQSVVLRCKVSHVHVAIDARMTSVQLSGNFAELTAIASGVSSEPDTRTQLALAAAGRRSKLPLAQRLHFGSQHIVC